ncbi:MAG: pyruvate ferredoxin oxidoreductase [Patescibacteria group bacterium]|nr:pyruvate ferredoxin oxidoreductase [Patescibacteria group bacterium]
MSKNIQSSKSQILEGSHAIALAIKNINPAVISAYPITPQTHIVEDLAKFKADGQAKYEYVRAESEFAAASIILGASATGTRVYSATSSQGLLLMTEVIFNIAGMRLPVVITCANRAVSAPISIWNDQQDAVTIRDAGWIMLFAENHQEAVDQHIIAYKVAEKLNLPVMVNIDGYILTHSYEPVVIPEAKQIKKYLPDYKPRVGQFLDPANPITMGAFATPAHYMEIRQDLHDDLISSLKVINEEYKKYKTIFSETNDKNSSALCVMRYALCENGLLEYYGPKNPKIILAAMGSVVGTIKEVMDENNSSFLNSKVGVLKVKTFRPFPAEEILKIIKPAKYIAVIDKSISLGQIGPLASDIKAAGQGKVKSKIQSFIVGLGGRDVTKEMIKKIIAEVRKNDDKIRFIGK